MLAQFQSRVLTECALCITRGLDEEAVRRELLLAHSGAEGATGSRASLRIRAGLKGALYGPQARGTYIIDEDKAIGEGG